MLLCSEKDERAATAHTILTKIVRDTGVSANDDPQHPDDTAPVTVDATIDHRARIESRARIVRSVVAPFAIISVEAQVTGATIGAFAIVGPAAAVGDEFVPLDRPTVHPFARHPDRFGLGEESGEYTFAPPTHVGADALIGRRAIVLPGVEVGIGAIVGAGAVVTHDVSPFTVVAGVPARPIRERFPASVREALLRIRWWEWPEERIRDELPAFSRDVWAFIREYDR